MANVIGVLGEATTATVATTTVYTCPSGYAAKGRIMFRALNAAVGNVTIEIFVNGMSIMKTGNIAVSELCYSVYGLGFISSGSTATVPDGLTAAKTVQPAYPIYYLSAGDTVTYTIATNALASINVQFVGVAISV